MTNDEYIQQYPHQFKDELDKWLFREFGVSGGACSSIESMKYSLAREVAQKAMEYAKQKMMKDAFVYTDKHDTACCLASECLRSHGWFNRERDFNDLFRHLSCVDELFEGKFSGKTKVIVIKEE